MQNGYTSIHTAVFHQKVIWDALRIESPRLFYDYRYSRTFIRSREFLEQRFRTSCVATAEPLKLLRPVQCWINIMVALFRPGFDGRRPTTQQSAERFDRCWCANSLVTRLIKRTGIRARKNWLLTSRACSSRHVVLSTSSAASWMTGKLHVNSRDETLNLRQTIASTARGGQSIYPNSRQQMRI